MPFAPKHIQKKNADGRTAMRAINDGLRGRCSWTNQSRDNHAIILNATIQFNWHVQQPDKYFKIRKNIHTSFSFYSPHGIFGSRSLCLSAAVLPTHLFLVYFFLLLWALIHFICANKSLHTMVLQLKQPSHFHLFFPLLFSFYLVSLTFTTTISSVNSC